ncbi:maltose ABC transporter substrate-binding protein [Alloiococcus sp. CFN-8]|uniref:sugar ABC transporter substrate-binding protein n=1 Tax=Alloiococcus sp. CFN-8 TaxID=3416081 RepID=UPI003CEA3F7B
MVKKLLALLMAVSLGVIAVGCGNGSDDKSGTDDKGGASSEEITLTVWESADGPDEFIKQAGEKFTEKNPNIKIEFVNVELGDTTGQIALDGPAGVGADIFVAPHDKLGELVSGGHVLPTENADAVKSAVLESTVKALTYEGKMYGYPVSAETYALFYNKALIDEANVPKTFDDLKTFAAENTKGDQYGFLMDVGNGYYTIIFTTSENNRLFGDSGTDTENTNINSEASIEGMKVFQDLSKVIKAPAADLGTEITDAAFASGKAALYISGPWNIKKFQDAGIDFGVTTLPSLPGNDTPAASFSGARGMFVSAYTDYPKEAALFAEFLISEEMQKLRFDITGAIPSIDVKVDSPYIAGFSQQLEHAFPMPSIPEMGKYWDAMNAASANIWGGADIKTELDNVDKALKAE